MTAPLSTTGLYDTALTACAVLTALIIAGRLLTFRRGARRYKRHLNLFAWLLINTAIALALILIQQGLPPAPFNILLTTGLALAACWVWHVQGNVAELIHTAKHALRHRPWTHH